MEKAYENVIQFLSQFKITIKLFSLICDNYLLIEHGNYLFICDNYLYMQQICLFYMTIMFIIIETIFSPVYHLPGSTCFRARIVFDVQYETIINLLMWQLSLVHIWQLSLLYVTIISLYVTIVFTLCDNYIYYM